MSLARAIASKGSRSAPPAKMLRLLSTGRLSSSLAHVGATRARAAGRGVAGALGAPKGVFENNSTRLMAREQQIRSLGMFSGDGGGVTHQMLKQLEKKAAQSPSDANAEVRITNTRQQY